MAVFVASRPPRRAANPVLPRSGGHGKGGRAESRADGSQTLRAAELNASREWASGIFQRAADNSENLKNCTKRLRAPGAILGKLHAGPWATKEFVRVGAFRG